jgi:hypothetical protein
MPERLDAKLEQIVERELPRLRRMKEAEAARPREPGKWSRKQVLGHLIDSASNNHQRFVRAQMSAELVFPGYAQNDWVSTEGFAEEGWDRIVDLWSALNRHLAHVISRIPQARLSTPCRIGDNAPMTLEALVADYIRHLEHHLEQI